MKILRGIVIAASVFAAVRCAAFAQSVPEIADGTEGGWTAEVSGLESGYYDISAECKNDSVEASCYMYGESAAATRASTVIPKSVYYTDGGETYASADGYVTVKVRGVYVGDGKLDIGLYTDGASAVYTRNVSVDKSSRQEAYEFLNGGDLTEYSYIKDLGGKYYSEDGQEADAIEYLAASGMNAARIRLSNTPGKGTGDGTYYLPAGYQDEEDCLKTARKAKENGMKIVFTFNYSDYWSNGTRQIIPSKWVEQIKEELGYDVKSPEFLRAMTSAQRSEIQRKLKDIIYDYTYNYMTRLKEQGTLPEYVSIGNEINGGMFFPFGNTYAANMNSERFELVFGSDTDDANDIKCPMDWSALASMLNAGYDAVKAVSPDSRVIIHLAEGSKTSTFTWFLDSYIKAGGKLDVIGASYYPFWSGNKVDACRTFCDEVGNKYGKDVMIMETGFNFHPTRKDGYGGQLSASGGTQGVYADQYPDSQPGHKGFMAELVNGMKNTSRCLGILYWDPIMIHVEDENGNNLAGWAYRESDDGVEPNVVENTTLFDFNGRAISSIGVYRDSKNSVIRAADEGLKVTDVSSVKEDEIIRAAVSLTNSSPETRTVIVCAAAYDADGRLTDVKQKTLTIAPYRETRTETKPLRAEAAKLYIWDGESLEPLSARAEIN